MLWHTIFLLVKMQKVAVFMRSAVVVGARSVCSAPKGLFPLCRCRFMRSRRGRACPSRNGLRSAVNGANETNKGASQELLALQSFAGGLPSAPTASHFGNQNNASQSALSFGASLPLRAPTTLRNPHYPSERTIQSAIPKTLINKESPSQPPQDNGQTPKPKKESPQTSKTQSTLYR